MAKIEYEKQEGWTRESYLTPEYGNILAPKFQGQVDRNNDGTWSGWFWISGKVEKSRFGFKSRAAAARWVNQQLRDVGVK